MISDILFDAVEDIRRYMIDPLFFRCYIGIEKELEELLTHMDRVRQLLDAPIQLGEFQVKPNGGQQ